MTTVTGRNGYEYDAEHISRDLYVVGNYIVRVEDGKVEETICRAKDQRRFARYLMDERNLGCVQLKGFGYVWPTHLRNDGGRFGEDRAEQAASRIVELLARPGSQGCRGDI